MFRETLERLEQWLSILRDEKVKCINNSVKKIYLKFMTLIKIVIISVRDVNARYTLDMIIRNVLELTSADR